MNRLPTGRLHLSVTCPARWLFTLVLCAVMGTNGIAQVATSHESLTEYQGTYEFQSAGTVDIAASPVDNRLYALLDGAKYPLSATTEPDVFTNVSDDRVVFERDECGAVLGYRLPDSNPGTLYRRHEGDTEFPVSMWYPKLEAQDSEYRWTYSEPEPLDDGLPVASIQGTNLDADRLNAMVNRIISRDHPDVHSVLIAADGKLVFEEYFYEYDRDELHQLRSASKSFISALVGIAIDQGLIESVEAPVLPYFQSEYENFKHLSPAKAAITVEQFLTHRSGLACDDWDAESPGNEVTMGASEDWVKFTLDLPMATTPGSEARYCSGGVKVLGRLVEKQAGMPLETFARKYLFEPLGINDFEWRFEPDASSINTFTQIYLKPRDMLKFGLLYANDGRWNGKQIISADWVELSTVAHSELGVTDYGYLWWRPYLNNEGGRHDAIAAQGNGGQEIYLWPDYNWVVVMTGGNYNRQSPSNRMFIEHILPIK